VDGRGAGRRTRRGWVSLAIAAVMAGALASPAMRALPPDASPTLLLRHHLPLPLSSAPVHSVVFTQEVAEELTRTWDASLEAGVEKARCLLGEREDSRLIVTELRRPDVRSATKNRVDFSTLPCLSRRFVGTLHTHPSGSCTLSGADLESFHSGRTAQVEVVLCDSGKIAWRDRQMGMPERTGAVLTLEMLPGRRWQGAD
jgi:proteasome lid subunit RPN8/RPN11